MFKVKFYFLRDEENPEKSGSAENKSELDLLKEIQKLKEDSVSKEDYEKLLKEKEEIVKQVINGDPVKKENQTKKPLEELIKDCQKEDITNLEYITNVLKAREACIEEKGYDPFAGRKGENAEKAANVAKVLQECVEEAQGRPSQFNAILQDRMIDPTFLQTYLAKRKKL